MRSKSIAIALAGIMFFFGMSTFAAAESKHYSEYVLKYKLNDKFDLFFTPEMRLKNDMGTLYYYHMRYGTTFHAHKNLDLALAHRFIQSKDGRGSWGNNDTHYIELIAIPKIKLAGFNLSDANKFEMRFIENATDRWVYRNLVTAAYPMKIKNFEFTPYVSNEIFLDFLLKEFNLNWATAGITKKISKNITVGFYYRDETSRVGASSTWVTAHIFGTNLTVEF